MIRPYLARESLAAFFLGITSGFPYAMIGATLTTRLAQDGIEKRAITAFALAFLVYNLKPLWAWIVDGVRLPVLGRLGQRCGVERAAVVEILLDAGDALGVEVDVADDVRARRDVEAVLPVAAAAPRSANARMAFNVVC